MKVVLRHLRKHISMDLDRESMKRSSYLCDLVNTGTKRKRDRSDSGDIAELKINLTSDFNDISVVATYIQTGTFPNVEMATDVSSVCALSHFFGCDLLTKFLLDSMK